ncbi:cytochrome-c peroxidase [Flaviaesturariibacter amylovorans]|uniref:Cytochrome c peroxidase n=1 Tax=Flaviaesturariibacter amylovorans TaxID=1084520 RepID=A0ABP8GDH0_9BACT
MLSLRPWTILSLLALLCGGGAALLAGCRRSDAFRATPMLFATPAGFPQPAYDFAAAPLTREGVELGRRLFYEGRLSSDGVHACGSCHVASASFTTPDHDLSHGVNSSHTTRNAPALLNLAWYQNYFQDGRYNSLESVTVHHLTSPTEMGETLANVVAKLQGDSAYRRLFRAAYGDETVSAMRLTDALKQFQLSMVSADSRYDKVKRGEAAFTTQEQSGYALFIAKCGSCHREPLFSDFSYRNTGLPQDPVLRDAGRMTVTGNGADSLKFRVPSLRNLSLSSYYGHDGRFSAFRLMLRHYQNGVQPGPTLDPLLAGGIPMTTAQEDDLVAFLFTLTDTAYVNNPRYRP